MDRYDLIVIGGGPGGYNTAVRASQLGLKVACVDRSPKIGGSGVNTGCLPSRILLQTSEIYAAARAGDYAAMGVEGMASLRLDRMMSYKTAIVDAMSDSVHAHLIRHAITLLRGHARLAGGRRVNVGRPDGTQSILAADHIVIATGSDPVAFPSADFDHSHILDFADALSLDRVPGHLAVIGAGATGIEIASIWQRLGARVTVVERCERICPWLDEEVALTLERALQRQGMQMELSTEAVGIERRGAGVRLRLQAPHGGSARTVDAEMVLVAIGCRPALTGLDLPNVGLQIGADGRLASDRLATQAAGIWLVGDVTGGQMLAHRAEEEAIACAEQIAGLPGFVDYSAMPSALFTNPEVAMIGRTEAELRAAGIAYKVGRAPFHANPRAQIRQQTDGFLKLLVDERTHLITGAHLIGPGAAELISEVAVAMEASMISEDLARISYAHPTLSEALRQAAMAAGGWRMQD
jgi:dihydrolipoamide dehydrogenase